MNVLKILRNGVAGALIAAVPVTASVAATRPGAAVPVAGSAAAAMNPEGGKSVSWAAIAVIVAAIAVAIWLALDDDNDGEGSLSRG